MQNNPLATIVVTPRERYSIVARTLQSIITHTPSHYPVLYIAGGAPPDILTYLTKVCTEHEYELLLKPDFMSPNAARNLGLAKATTKYIAFIENDVIVEEGWLEALIQCAEEEKADIVSPLCLIGEPTNRDLHSLGGKLILEHVGDKLHLREQHHYGPISLLTDPRKPIRMESDYSEFHCMLIRQSVFDQIGFLDEKIVGAAEHIDLALHLRKLNCRGFAEPTAVVSYLPLSYTIADLDTYTLRWSNNWHFPTMKHLCEKWELSSNSGLFSDYFSSFTKLRERCLLRQEFSDNMLPTQIEHFSIAQTIVQLLNQMEECKYSIEAQARIQNTYLTACQLFTSIFRASGKTFLEHLVGTASILTAFGANPAVISAALLQASYTQGRFPNGFGNSINAMKRWLKRRVGHGIENLVYQYSCLHFDDAAQYLYRNTRKNPNFGKEAPQNLRVERVAIAQGQDTSEHTNFEKKPTTEKADSSGCFGIQQSIDNMPIQLANTILIRIANGIEDRTANETTYFDSAEWLQKSNALISQWMPIFTTTATRLGMPGLITILKNSLVKAQPGVTKHGLQSTQSSNYYVQIENGSIEPIINRNILKSKELRSSFNKKKTQFMHAVPIKKITICKESKGSVIYAKGCAILISDPEPWAYSAQLCIEKAIKKIKNDGRVIIEICLHTECGSIGILILERGSSVYQIAPEQSISMSEKPVTIRFEIEDIKEAGEIIFRKWPSDDRQAHVKIFSVNILAMNLSN